jgi:hypothetical protein
MVFSLYGAPAGGNRIGTIVTNTLSLANGLYSVVLDFGAGAFTGDTRWLDVAVVTNGLTCELSPRVQVTPAPYAIFAASAGTVTNGAITSAQLAVGAVGNINLGDSVVNTDNIAHGQVVKSLNGQTDAVTLSAGSGLALTTNGNTLEFSSTCGNCVGSNNDLVDFASVGKQVAVLLYTNGVGTEYTILTQSGAGCLTHMYFSGLSSTAMRIRVYVDGETAPSIDMASDLGTGYHGNTLSPAGNSQMGATGGIFNNYHIPFGNGIRVAVIPSSTPSDPTLWWLIRGTQNLPLVVAGQTLPSTARLHLYRNEWATVYPLQEFNLFNVASGNGLVYQVTVAAVGNNAAGQANMDYLQGEMRGYFNGSGTATLLSSGTDDFFLASAYFSHEGLYWGEAAGLTSLNTSAGNNSFSAYRLFTQDPLMFQNGMRLTLKCGEQVNGITVGSPQITQYATYSWVYQW